MSIHFFFRFHPFPSSSHYCSTPYAFSALTLLVGRQEGAGVVICLDRGADLHTAQLMPLPLTVSGFSKIQIGFTFLVPARLGSPGQRAVKRMYCFTPLAAILSALLNFLPSNARH